jgi:hypothetical protein
MHLEVPTLSLRSTPLLGTSEAEALAVMLVTMTGMQRTTAVVASTASGCGEMMEETGLAVVVAVVAVLGLAVVAAVVAAAVVVGAMLGLAVAAVVGLAAVVAVVVAAAVVVVTRRGWAQPSCFPAP